MRATVKREPATRDTTVFSLPMTTMTTMTVMAELKGDAVGLPLAGAEIPKDATAVVKRERERELSDGDSRHDDSNSDDHHARDGGRAQTAPRVKKRRRHEVLRLRQVAEELQHELSALQRREETAETARTLANNADPLRAHRVAAKRAVQAATRAQLENAKLRASAAAYSVLATSLQQAVAKQRDFIQDVDACVPDVAPGGTIVRTTLASLSAHERSIYERLLHNAAVRGADLDAYIASRCFTALKLSSTLLYAETAEATVLLDDRQCVCIDFVDQYVLPFDFHAGANVLWTRVLARTLQFASRAVAQTEIITCTDDTVVSKQSGNSNYLTDCEQFTIEYAISKRITKTDSVGFLWEALAESSESSAAASAPSLLNAAGAMPGIQLVQEGWGSIARMETSSRSSAASVLQSHIRLTPSMATKRADAALSPLTADDQCLDAAPPLDVVQLSSHIIRAFRRHAATIRCYLESTLLDDMLRNGSSSDGGTSVSSATARSRAGA